MRPIQRGEEEYGAYQEIDEILHRQGWRAALKRLRRELGDDPNPHLPQEFIAEELGLPSPWDWSQIEQMLERDGAPVPLFNRLLNLIFRGQRDPGV